MWSVALLRAHELQQLLVQMSIPMTQHSYKCMKLSSYIIRISKGIYFKLYVTLHILDGIIPTRHD